jgi:hypothetical protein
MCGEKYLVVLEQSSRFRNHFDKRMMEEKGVDQKKDKTFLRIVRDWMQYSRRKGEIHKDLR